MSEPLRLDPGAKWYWHYEWRCPACNTTCQRLDEDGLLVPNPGQAKALCDGCLRAAKEGV